MWKDLGVTKLKVEQGSTFTYSWDVLNTSGEPLNLTISGTSARIQLRKRTDDPLVLAEYLSGTSGLTLTASGQVILMIPASASVAWPFRRAVWDLEIAFPDASVLRRDSGLLTVSPEVTR